MDCVSCSFYPEVLAKQTNLKQEREIFDCIEVDDRSGVVEVEEEDAQLYEDVPIPRATFRTQPQSELAKANEALIAEVENNKFLTIEPETQGQQLRETQLELAALKAQMLANMPVRDMNAYVPFSEGEKSTTGPIAIIDVYTCGCRREIMLLAPERVDGSIPATVARIDKHSPCPSCIGVSPEELRLQHMATVGDIR